MSAMIDIKDLSKGFEQEVLRKVNLTLSKNQTLGLIGRNGAGKTTLIKIILGFLKSTSGFIKVLGKEPGDVAGEIGYLPEKPDYHLVFSGKEYLTYLAKLSGIEETNKRVNELISLVGMNSFGSKRMSRYSKGMLQRIGLAQSLLLDPSLLILDEPLSGLDPAGQRDLRDIIIQLGKLDKSILICSHLLGEVEKVCSDIAILHQGTIIRQGNLGDILEHQSKYQIRVEGLSKQSMKELKTNFCIECLNEELILFRETYKGEKEKFLRFLIEQGGIIYELRPLKKSLEEFFIISTGEKL